MDRYDTSGDAQLGFWFLAENPQPAANGTFTNGVGGPPAKHQTGDLLVLANFSNGGTTPSIQVYQWFNGAPVLFTGGTVLCNTDGTIPSSGFCGITNGGPVDAPWTYQNKDLGVTAQFPRGAFFEGGIDLTGLGLAGCFTGFITESRSSTSITATLKDFVDPGNGFGLCSISIDKACVDGALIEGQTKMRFTIKGKITNKGAAPLYKVTLDDDPDADFVNGVQHFDAIDCDTLADTGLDFPVTLASGAKICYQATITKPVGSQSFQDKMKVTANSQADGNGTVVQNESELATCTPPVVLGGIKVTKGCTTELFDNGDELAVRVNVTGTICNGGGATGSNLKDITLEDSVFTIPQGTLFKTTLALDDPNTQGPDSLGECMSYAFSYVPSSMSPGANASNICFPDVVTVRANDLFGVKVQAQTASASCSLCPSGACTAP
jgi:hypothetical protein